MTNTEQTILDWLQNNPLVFQHRLDSGVLTLKELFSRKEITFALKQITAMRLQNHPQGLGSYLNIVLDGHLEIVLCHAGIAFSPSFENTGPIPDAPPVTCLQDYKSLLNQLLALLAEEERKTECLLLFNLLIATLDGAKKVGIDVSFEEESLDQLLTEFENNFKPTSNESD